MTSSTNSIELNYGEGSPTHCIIWLHGLGASANDFPPIVPELGLSNDRMPGWYDIKGVTIDDKQDAVGMAESQQLLEGLVEEQIAKGISSENIILAGFSQGGAVAYFTGVRSKQKFAGLLALSTYLPFDQNTKREQSGANLDTPIFASHGSYDAVVPLAMGKRSVDILGDLGYSVKWKTYPMEHQVVMEQIQEIGSWINNVFSKA